MPFDPGRKSISNQVDRCRTPLHIDIQCHRLFRVQKVTKREIPIAAVLPCGRSQSVSTRLKKSLFHDVGKTRVLNAFLFNYSRYRNEFETEGSIAGVSSPNASSQPSLSRWPFHINLPKIASDGTMAGRALSTTLHSGDAFFRGCRPAWLNRNFRAFPDREARK